MKHDIERLKTIKKVTAPPHLYLQIRQKIEAIQKERYTPIVSIALSVAAMLLIILNLWVIIQVYTLPLSNETQILTQLFTTLSQNDIYLHE